MEKVVTFFDFANINAPARKNCVRLDYRHLLDYLSCDRFLIDAHAYVPIDPRNEHGLDATIDELWRAGFLVHSKVGSIAGETFKCNVDVEMAIDILNIAHTVKPDIIVIASGDGDMLPIVHALRKMGIRVEVASFESCISRKLALQASGFISLDRYIEEANQDQGQAEYDFEESLPAVE